MVDPSDTNSIKKFFEENPYLSTYELAVRAGKSPSTIRNWKRKCGIILKDSPFKTKREYKKRDVGTVDDAAVWDNEAWFREKYEDERLGIPTIARMIGRSVSLVAGRLIKYDISTRPHSDAVKSVNPACSEEWLYYHYATKELYTEWCNKNARQVDLDGGKTHSLAKCAELAGVVPYTIYNWLVRFRIPMRDISEAMTGENNPFYGRKHSDATKARIRDAYWKTRSEPRSEKAPGEGGVEEDPRTPTEPSSS
jgi:transposase